ncbi:hypothetical protein [Hyphomicrobium sp.]|uniref:DUF6959 family protein n=1 Tax=Hyphomicrobium sp. TaxID=82 RepID=UPI000FABA1A9|nr:hypothetical protein [Hyphomicrobium sp.]RUP11085.1 MAG: hypothetical protein EKK38_01105 [Hyphomicrobium sp.]
MNKELVEIYSDATNYAVMRHPGRRFPGILIQGDTLYSIVYNAESAKAALGRGDLKKATEEIDELVEGLRARLDHYKKVLLDHGLPLPFVETPRL